jgi:putative transposase
MEIYSSRTAANTILFLEKVIEEMRFPVQSIQTDRGREFFAYKIQEWLARDIASSSARYGQGNLT